MIPDTTILTQSLTETTYPIKTHRIVFGTNDPTKLSRNVLSLTVSADTEPTDRISGYVDDLQAVAQAVYLILSTERYKFIIYSWDYGVELVDLFGKPMPYVMAELPRRIKEALTQDNRITDVTDFQFEKNGKRLLTTFTVVSNVGNISTELEVEV